MNNKKIIYVIIFILICLLSIGYAALVSNISIVGTAKMKANTFDVHFENITVSNGSVEIDTSLGDSAATIEPTNRTRIDYSVTLEKPGDFYEFTVKVVNGGTIDAMIDTVTSKINNVEINNNLPKFLEYNITYDDDIAIANNHMLNAGDVETYKVRVGYRTDINPSDLPTTASTTTFSFNVNYIQKNNSALTRANYIFTTSSSWQYKGQPFNTTSSPNQETAMSELGHDFFLRHKVENGNITESYVGFKVGGKIYYIRGGVSELKTGSKPIYTANKKEMTKAFGSNNCNETTSNAIFDHFVCSNGSFSVNILSYGSAVAWDNSYSCGVSGEGSSQCFVP